MTSPPYFGLRDYGTGEWEGGDPDCDHRQLSTKVGSATTLRNDGRAHKGLYESEKAVEPGFPFREACGKCGARRVDRQIGLEPTPDEFVAALVAVFREVRRVLRDDGTVWLNLGDSYASDFKGGGGMGKSTLGAASGGNGISPEGIDRSQERQQMSARRFDHGCKPKDLMGVPWAVAQALRAPYYGGEIKAERDRVWLAATLDAEGCISGFTHERADGDGIRTGVHITITNTNERLLAEADRIWPASRVEHENHGEGHLGRRPSWRWLPHGAERKALLMRELYPYMIAKREQARLAYALFALSVDAKRLGHSPQRDAVREKRAWIVAALSRLNQGEGIDVPSWIGEPPTVEEPGWYLRSDIIWAKPNPMPESVTDRPTKSHEFIFLLSKSAQYAYDADAIREDNSPLRPDRAERGYNVGGSMAPGRGDEGPIVRPFDANGRNKRSVWTVATQPYPGAHFATFPPKLIEPCILAGCPEGGVVLDPFAGAGTTGVVALRHNRAFIGIELNAEYADLARPRLERYWENTTRPAEAAQSESLF